MDVLAFFGWLGVSALVAWGTAFQLPAGYGNAQFLLQLAAMFPSAWMIARGLPTWIDPSYRVVETGTGGRNNYFTTWPRAKGRRHALAGVATLAAATLLGWGLEHAIGLPARHARRIADEVEPRLLAAHAGLDACLATVWTRGPEACRLRYEVTAADAGARATLVDAACATAVVATCARLTRGALAVTLSPADRATVAYAGGLEVGVVLPLLRGGGPPPRVERAP